MQAELPALIKENLIAALQECRQKKDVQQARQLHAYMCQQQLDCHPVFGNHLVPMLAECGGLADAQLAFDRLPCRNEHSWTSLISGYISSGDPQHAFLLYDKMQHDRTIRPNRVTYLTLLNACTQLKDAEKGRQLHADIILQGLERELTASTVGNTLVDMYGKCSLLAEACQVFDQLPVRNAVSWAALITAYAEHGSGEEVQFCLQKMKSEGISPDSITLICSLKACGKTGAVETGYEIHADILRTGMETQPHVGSTLVDMYMRVGLIAEACQVFNKPSIGYVCSWSALIAGYTEHGLQEEVESCFNQMQLQSLPLDAATSVCSLKACGIFRLLETGQKLHTEVTKMGLETELYVGSILVEMYNKCSSLSEARDVFHRLPVRDAVSWAAMIPGYTEHGLGEKAWNCFKEMQLEGISPDSVTVVCTLKACGTIGSLETSHKVHSEVLKRGLETELYVGSTLVDAYLKCGSLAEAWQVFDRLQVRDVVLWNAVIAGYTEEGNDKEAWNCFRKMHLEGVSADAVTFVCSLKACCVMGALETGYTIHAELTRRGLEREPNEGSALVDMYTRCGLLAEAVQVFDCLPNHNLMSWNALISGFAEHGLGKEVNSCFQQMQLNGTSPDSVTFVCALKACENQEFLNFCQRLHVEVIKRGLETDNYVGNTLVDVYSKNSLFAEARHVFEGLPHRDAVCWNALISGYADHGFDSEVESSFKQMQLEGISVDAVTFVLCLKSCGIIEALETGQVIHAELTKRGLEKEHFVGHTLVDMYSKCSLLTEAGQVFDKLSIRGLGSWNAMISGYAEHGLDDQALNCFKEMQLEGMSADVVTFVVCLKACSGMVALETGREIHAEIWKLGSEADVVLGNVMVDMYGRCGLVGEAWSVFNSIPIRNVITWNAMIKAFGENHHGYMAVQSFENMQKQGVMPDSITFTCLLAACSHSSLIYEGQAYFKLIREKCDVEATVEHYACMVDLLGRSGHVYEAERFIGGLQRPPCSVILMALLNACKIYGEVELGERCFQQLVETNQEDASAYLLMTDMYACVGRWLDANRVEEMRSYAGAKKKAGNASLEVDGSLHVFVVGIKQSKEMTQILTIVSLSTRHEGYVPNLDMTTKGSFDAKGLQFDYAHH